MYFQIVLFSCLLLNQMEGPETQSLSPALSAYLIKDYISIHKFPPLQVQKKKPTATLLLYHYMC